ncbi:MAG: MFS transporter [Desulfobacterales bacterium]|jgi:MFS family permease
MKVGPAPKLNYHERRILLTTAYGHFMSHFNMLVFPALVLPLALRLNAELAMILGLSFWMYLLFGLTALPWGIIADRFGARKLLLIFFLGAGISSICAALWMDYPVIFASILAALGLFSGIYHPAGLGLISKEMTRVSLGMGYNGVFGNLGLAMAPLLTGMINWLWGPRAAYFILGGLNLCGVILMMAYPVTESKPGHSTQSGKGNGMVTAFLFLLAAMMLAGIIYRGATVILPTYFELKTPLLYQWLATVARGEFSPNLVATTVTSFIFLVGILGQYSGGRCAERFDPRLCYLIFFGITGPAAFFMTFALDQALVGLAVIFFFFLLGMQPIENTLIARFTPKRFHHSAYGTKFILTFGVGALAVKMVAAIEAAYDIGRVFFSLSLIVGIALGFIGLLIIKTRQHIDAKVMNAVDLQVPSPKL